MVRELVSGLERRGYAAPVLHRGNAVPQWLQHPEGRFGRDLGSLLISWYLGRGLRQFSERGLSAVITNGPVGWYVPTFNGASPKRIHIYHGTYRAQAEAIRPFIRFQGYLKLKWWDSMVLERACGAGKLVFCNSDQTREEVHRFFGHEGVSISLPLDTAHFQPLNQSGCRRALGLPEQGAVGLFVGSAHPMKGFPIVQSLTRSLSGIRWILALRGTVPPNLESDPMVKVLANVSYDSLPTIYGAANFAVFPSRYEPFGYVVAEALACGTPVIATIGGASRLFLSGPPLDALLINDSSDHDKYVAAIRMVLDDEAKYRGAVVHVARPKIIQTMAPENWWPRLWALTGL